MFSNNNDEYINATKNARINRYDDSQMSSKLWFVNFSLFSLLLIGSYYTYLYVNKDKRHKTAVMGVSHINVTDNDLMKKLYDIEVDKITVERDDMSIADAMKKIIDKPLVKANSKYVEALVLDVDTDFKSKTKKMKFEEKISNELKLIN